MARTHTDARCVVTHTIAAGTITATQIAAGTIGATPIAAGLNELGRGVPLVVPGVIERRAAVAPRRA